MNIRSLIRENRRLAAENAAMRKETIERCAAVCEALRDQSRNSLFRSGVSVAAGTLRDIAERRSDFDSVISEASR